MKKYIAFALILVFVLTGCAAPNEESTLSESTQSSKESTQSSTESSENKSEETTSSSEDILKEFLREADGIWVDSDEYPDLGFNFIEFSDGNFYRAIYCGDADRVGHIISAEKQDDTYEVKIHYSEEIYFDELLEEETLTMYFTIIKNSLVMDDSDVVYIYKGKSFEDLVDLADSYNEEYDPD